MFKNIAVGLSLVAFGMASALAVNPGAKTGGVVQVQKVNLQTKDENGVVKKANMDVVINQQLVNMRFNGSETEIKWNGEVVANPSGVKNAKWCAVAAFGNKEGEWVLKSADCSVNKMIGK